MADAAVVTLDRGELVAVLGMTKVGCAAVLGVAVLCCAVLGMDTIDCVTIQDASDPNPNPKRETLLTLTLSLRSSLPASSSAAQIPSYTVTMLHSHHKSPWPDTPPILAD